MSERSCADCKWNYKERCIAPVPKVMVHGPSGTPISGGWANCPTWEKREPTREERIVAAAIDLAGNYASGGSNPCIQIQLPMFNKLRDACGMKPVKEWKTPTPPRSEKRTALLRAGWKPHSPEFWTAPDGGFLCYTDDAYAEMIRQADCR